MLRRISEPAEWCGNDRFVGYAASRRSSGRRVSLWLGEILLIAIVVVGFVMMTSAIFSEQRAAPERVALKGHTQVVEALTFSPDGSSLASCGWDNSVRLWNLSGMSNGSLVDDPTILTHDSVRFALAFSPDGKRLASGGDRSLTIWSCASPGPEPLAFREGTTYRCLAFSPDGSMLALGCDDGTVVLVDSNTANQQAVLRGHCDVVRSLAFSPDGSLLVSSGQDRQIMLWDAKSGTRIRSLGRPGISPVQFVAFSPRGDEIAVGELSGSAEGIVLIDPFTGDIRSSLAGHYTGVTALAYSPDGQTLATAGVDRTIKFWNIKHGKERAALIEGVGCVRSISFSPNGEWLAYAGSDLTVKLWHVSGERTVVVGRCPLKV
jgi:WD40 repeat protein